MNVFRLFCCLCTWLRPPFGRGQQQLYIAGIYFDNWNKKNNIDFVQVIGTSCCFAPIYEIFD